MSEKAPASTAESAAPASSASCTRAASAAASASKSAVPVAMKIDTLVHRYKDRQALKGVSFDVVAGEIFGLLGPNGSGKTTLFRVLSTLLPPQEGRVEIYGRPMPESTAEIRRDIGVVFQAPSLDKKLTAAENLRHQGHLYGLRGAALETRIGEMLERVKLADRAHDLTETLSGGQRRRVELAKGLLHRPRILLLDEPSTGLDPGARRDLMQHLKDLSRHDGVTCLLTTHLMEEAEACDRLAILSQGHLVALDKPAQLKARIGGDIVTLECGDAKKFAHDLNECFACDARVDEGAPGRVRIEREDGAAFVAQVAEAFPGRMRALQVGRPALEDVFLQATGRRFWQEDEENKPQPKKKKR